MSLQSVGAVDSFIVCCIVVGAAGVVTQCFVVVGGGGVVGVFGVDGAVAIVVAVV